MNKNTELQRKPGGQVSGAREQAAGTAEGSVQTIQPLVDVIEDAAGITLYADLPGVPRDKLSLQLETDSLTIEGEVAIDVPDGMQSHHAELRVPRYRRSFKLSRELDGEKASAELKNGVLQLRIPKAEHAQPRKIEVRSA